VAKLLGLNIAKIVAQSMPGMYRGTLTSKTPGTRTVGNPGAGTNPTSLSFGFKGFAATYKKPAVGLVRNASHTILILAATCKAEPEPGDTIVMAVGGDPELGGKTCVIVEDGVERDPASATWLCHVQV
jgi:hypothetical protein